MDRRGHEIEHVDHYHCAERLQTEAALRQLPLVGVVVAIPIELFQAGYTKDEELELVIAEMKKIRDTKAFANERAGAAF